MPRRLYIAAWTLDPAAPQFSAPQLLFAESLEEATGEATEILGLTPTLVVDVTRQLTNELGSLVEIARANREAADGSKVFALSQADVVRTWLGETLAQCCPNCGQTVSADVAKAVLDIPTAAPPGAL